MKFSMLSYFLVIFGLAANAVHAQKLDFANPLAPLEHQEKFCLEFNGPASDPYELEKWLRSAVLFEEKFNDIRFYRYPQNGECSESQWQIYVKPSEVHELARILGKHYSIKGDIKASEYNNPSSEATQKMFKKLGDKMAALHSRLKARGVDEKFESMVKELQDMTNEKEVFSLFSQYNEREAFTALRRQITIYERIVKLSHRMSPIGFAEFKKDIEARYRMRAQIPPEIIGQLNISDGMKNDALDRGAEARRALSNKDVFDSAVVGHIIFALFNLFDEPVFHAHTLDSASYMALMTIKELEDQYPAGLIIHHINRYFVLRTLETFYRFHNSRLGPAAKEFLEYLLRYRPHVHPLIALTASGILKNAGHPSSLAPDKDDKAAYEALKSNVVMKESRAYEDLSVPHVVFGDVDPQLAAAHKNIHYIDKWFSRHKLETTAWFQHKGPTFEILTERSIKLLNRKITHADCQGFLTSDEPKK